MAENTVTLIGNVTRDPELRFTGSGQAVATIGLAVSRRYQQGGEWQEQTSFFNIVAYGQLGENAAHSLERGSRIIVNGRLQQRSYETQSGEKRNVVEVIADELGPSLRWATARVEKNDRRGAGESGGSGGQQRPAPAPAPDYGFDEEPF